MIRGNYRTQITNKLTSCSDEQQSTDIKVEGIFVINAAAMKAPIFVILARNLLILTLPSSLLGNNVQATETQFKI